MWVVSFWYVRIEKCFDKQVQLQRSFCKNKNLNIFFSFINFPLFKGCVFHKKVFFLSPKKCKLFSNKEAINNTRIDSNCQCQTDDRSAIVSFVMKKINNLAFGVKVRFRREGNRQTLVCCEWLMENKCMSYILKFNIIYVEVVNREFNSPQRVWRVSLGILKI